MCGVSVRGVVGDICLCLLFLQIFACDCFCSICFFFLLLSIFFCKFGSASFINNLNLTGYAGGQPGGRLSGGRRWTAVGGGRRQIMCNSVSQEPTNSSRYFYNADNKCVYTSIYIYII